MGIGFNLTIDTLKILMAGVLLILIFKGVISGINDICRYSSDYHNSNTDEVPAAKIGHILYALILLAILVLGILTVFFYLLMPTENQGFGSIPKLFQM